MLLHYTTESILMLSQAVTGACNAENRTIFTGDNLPIQRGINTGCIDLIYLDPPFNKNKRFKAPAGTDAEGAGFKDIFREADLKPEWLNAIQEDRPDLFQYLCGVKRICKSSTFAYLSYMAIRLIECRRILKPKGSIYLHCDSTMSHYLKTTMDGIFGEDLFRNEIIWKRNPSHEDSRVFGRVTETILFYGTDINKDFVRVPIDAETRKAYKHCDERGRYRPENLKSGGLQGGGYTYEFYGHSGPWRCPEATMRQYEADGMIHCPKKPNGVPQRKRYLHNHPGIVPTNIWLDIKKARGKQHVGYPAQKPVALLKRIILASSNEGDVVLDPFCGCATTCIAAENLNRRWIGIDVSPMSFELAKLRLSKEVDYPVAARLEVNPPLRTD